MRMIEVCSAVPFDIERHNISVDYHRSHQLIPFCSRRTSRSQTKKSSMLSSSGQKSPSNSSGFSMGFTPCSTASSSTVFVCQKSEVGTLVSEKAVSFLREGVLNLDLRGIVPFPSN